jgi:Cu(I)/Ag(I) efflux system periplasmic protein CusF
MKYRNLFATGAFALLTALTPVAANAQADEAVPGLVTKIDESANKITIKHGPLKKFEMEDGMTMVFHVLDPALLKTVKPGDKVKFVPDRINGQFTVTKIEKAR